MEKELIQILKDQTIRLFENIELTLEKIDDEWLSREGFRWLPWKQLYHMIHSIDQWFINPYVYKHPDFHTPGMNSLSNNSNEKILTKKEFYSYFHSIQKKISLYLDSLETVSLVEKPEKCKFSRFELILGQFRHISYHIGFLHCCMNRDFDILPVFKGLGAPIEPV